MVAIGTRLPGPLARDLVEFDRNTSKPGSRNTTAGARGVVEYEGQTDGGAKGYHLVVSVVSS